MVLDRDYRDFQQVANNDTLSIPGNTKEIRFLLEGHRDQIITTNKVVLVDGFYQLRYVSFTKTSEGPPISTYSLISNPSNPKLSVEEGFLVIFADSVFESGEHILPYVDDGFYFMTTVKKDEKSRYAKNRVYYSTLNRNTFSSASDGIIKTRTMLMKSTVVVPGLTHILDKQYVRGAINFSLVTAGLAIFLNSNNKYNIASNEFDNLYIAYQNANFPSLATSLGNELDSKSEELTSLDNTRRLALFGLGTLIGYSIWDSRHSLTRLTNAGVRFETELTRAKLTWEF